MNPSVPRDAQLIVGAYLKVVERNIASDDFPCPLRELPHPKEMLRAAFETTIRLLGPAGHLTSELREYLEFAYVSLADYVDEECVALLKEYARASTELEQVGPRASDKVTTPAWQRLTEQSRLAGELARAISQEAERLRREFRSWQSAAPSPCVVN